jgi:hypothetical protein
MCADNLLDKVEIRTVADQKLMCPEPCMMPVIALRDDSRIIVDLGRTRLVSALLLLKAEQLVVHMRVLTHSLSPSDVIWVFLGRSGSRGFKDRVHCSSFFTPKSLKYSWDSLR